MKNSRWKLVGRSACGGMVAVEMLVGEAGPGVAEMVIESRSERENKRDDNYTEKAIEQVEAAQPPAQPPPRDVPTASCGYRMTAVRPNLSQRRACMRHGVDADGDIFVVGARREQPPYSVYLRRK